MSWENQNCVEIDFQASFFFFSYFTNIFDKHTFTILSVASVPSWARVAWYCMCFLNTTHSREAGVNAAFPDDHVTMCTCKPNVTLARVVVDEINACSYKPKNNEFENAILSYLKLSAKHKNIVFRSMKKRNRKDVKCSPMCHDPPHPTPTP